MPRDKLWAKLAAAGLDDLEDTIIAQDEGRGQEAGAGAGAQRGAGKAPAQNQACF